ncbi:MAG: aminoacyl--tRNA ligase-related protein [Patescibacteria group bacterium UBA2103]
MRQSTLISKTRKEAPKDEEAKNAQLLIRAGYVHKEMAGAYTFLPLGWRVLQNIERIIREEMDKVGGQELHLTALQNKEIWEESNRWSDEVVDVWFKAQLKAGGEVGFAPTHEEPLTNLLTDHISSYKDLPRYAYQIQTKFRNELRAKSGLLRGREFRMKDLYSFSKNEEEHEVFYEKMKEAYMNVFTRLGIGDRTFITFASGGSFAEFSHEFQMVTEAGEDTIYLDEDKKVAVNDEVYTDEVLEKLSLSKDSLKEVRASEVGNIFSLGTRFSLPLKLMYKDESGEAKPVVMGSYGIGSSRLVGAIAEALGDEKGLVWPKEISPFDIHLVQLQDEVSAEAEKMYNTLIEKGYSVLWDDRDKGAGEKFADADLIGISKRVVVSKRGVENGVYEVVDRVTGETAEMKEEEVWTI